MPKLSIAARQILHREWILAQRNMGEWLVPTLFFVLVACLFPIAMQSQLLPLDKLASPVIWISAMLAILLSLESSFRTDFQIGIYEQWFLSQQYMPLVLLLKLCVHWCINCLPLILSVPIVLVLYNIPWSSMPIILLSLLLGTPSVTFIGAIGTALTLSLPKGGLLLALIILPLTMPVLIISVMMISYATEGISLLAYVALLSGILLLCVATVPLAIKGALKVSMMA